MLGAGSLFLLEPSSAYDWDAQKQILLPGILIDSHMSELRISAPAEGFHNWVIPRQMSQAWHSTLSNFSEKNSFIIAFLESPGCNFARKKIFYFMDNP